MEILKNAVVNTNHEALATGQNVDAEVCSAIIILCSVSSTNLLKPAFRLSSCKTKSALL